MNVIVIITKKNNNNFLTPTLKETFENFESMTSFALFTDIYLLEICVTISS